jgi:hypothetical protein
MNFTAKKLVSLVFAASLAATTLNLFTAECAPGPEENNPSVERLPVIARRLVIHVRYNTPAGSDQVCLIYAQTKGVRQKTYDMYRGSETARLASVDWPLGITYIFDAPMLGINGILAVSQPGDEVDCTVILPEAFGDHGEYKAVLAVKAWTAPADTAPLTRDSKTGRVIPTSDSVFAVPDGPFVLALHPELNPEDARHVPVVFRRENPNATGPALKPAAA